MVCSQGYDPRAKEKFKPRLKTKGRSSSGKVEKRKKQVAHEDQRVRCSTERKTVRFHSAYFTNMYISLYAFPHSSVCSSLKHCGFSSPQDVIRQTVEDRMKIEKEKKEKDNKQKALAGQKSALDRFKK